MIRLGLLALLGVLAACGQTQPAPPGIKIGNPYVIDGKTYYPEYDANYDTIGEASWYGPGFHNKHTANGEVFNQNDITAAHPTLPMPSLVRVTNLENGKSLIVRVNDRGPFKSNRIIDLSKKSAQLLGIHSLAKVRVQFLEKETQGYIAQLKETGDHKIDMAAYNKTMEAQKDYSILAPTEPSAEIVESNVSTTQPGQTVVNAAPVMTVGSEELADNAPKTGLVKNVWADDNITLPSPSTPKIIKVENQPEEKTQPVEIKSQDSKPPIMEESIVKIAKIQKPKPEASPSAGGARYVIQAGSFAAEENAKKLGDKLSALGKALVEKVQMNGKTWWRVRLGPFNDKTDADTMLGEVRAAGVPDARITHQ